MKNIYKVLNIATVKHNWEKQPQLGFYCKLTNEDYYFLGIYSEHPYIGELEHIGTTYYKPEISKITETNIL